MPPRPNPGADDLPGSGASLIWTLDLPHIPEGFPHTGVYMLAEQTELVYIGQSTHNTAHRCWTHFRDKRFSSVAVIGVELADLDIVESVLIHHFEPKYNGRNFGGSMRAPLTVKKLKQRPQTVWQTLQRYNLEGYAP
jgi:hypothetical protein